MTWRRSHALDFLRTWRTTSLQLRYSAPGRVSISEFSQSHGSRPDIRRRTAAINELGEAFPTPSRLSLGSRFPPWSPCHGKPRLRPRLSLIRRLVFHRGSVRLTRAVPIRFPPRAPDRSPQEFGLLVR